MGFTWPLYQILLSQKMKIHSLLNLPQLPSALLDHITASIIGAPMQKVSGRKIVQLDGSTADDAVYNRWPLSQEYTEYVNELIPELSNSNFNIGFQSIANSSGQLCQLHPHTDGAVRGPFCIAFLISTGGMDVETIWWQQHEQDLLRSPWSHVWDLASLDKVDSVVFPEGRWNIMRTDLIHSVQNIDTNRVAFTIGFFDEDLFDLIQEKYAL